MTNHDTVPNPDRSHHAAELAGTVAARASVEGSDIYAHKFDPNTPDTPAPKPGDWAAIQTPGAAAAVGAKTEYLDRTGMPVAPRPGDRPGYWIAPTADQIKANPGLAQQEKYFPPGR